MTHYPRVCYEIFVRSFCDSNGDGIGDLNGITSRLDYLSELGISGIWLTPVQPSPSYHKYDVTDYYSIDPEFGNLDDFRRLISEAHTRGIHVYMDLVIHHVSIRHEWFVEARSNPVSPRRGYFRWMSDHQIGELGLGKRELTQDAHTVNPWHRIPGSRERYLGIFSREMADLNFENEELREEIYKVVRFWLEIGVDGFRLDAARHIYPPWENDRNPVFWKGFAKRLQEICPDVFLVGEVWADSDEVAPFFEGLNANFNFDLWLKIAQVLTGGQHYNLAEWLKSQREYYSKFADAFVDAIILSNHDQQRIGSTVNGNREKMKLAAAIYLTLPGQPYLYYGEEIGMLGRKPDPGLREPFLWGDPDLTTRWRQSRFSKEGKVKSLRDAFCDPGSLYYCYKNLIDLRNRYSELGAVNFTEIEPVESDSSGVLMYKRPGETNSFLIIHNLTGEKQEVEISSEHFIVRYASNPKFSYNHSKLTIGAYNSLILHLLP